MTSKENDELEDKELLDRYRRAGGTIVPTPSDAVRAAILAEGRRVAGQLANQGSHANRESKSSFDTSRPAANDARWKITAFGTMGAALLAALLIAPRYWETLPASKQTASSPALPQMAPPAALSQGAPPAAPAPKLESVAPRPSRDALQEVTAARRRAEVHQEKAANAPPSAAASADAASQSAPEAYVPPEEKPPRAGPARSADSGIGEAADRMFKRSQTPGTLLSAAKSGDVPQATALIDRGAALDVRDSQGRTPLMLAVSEGRLEVVRLLLQRGADPNAADNSGKTPLRSAMDQNLTDIAELLRGAGAGAR